MAALVLAVVVLVVPVLAADAGLLDDVQLPAAGDRADERPAASPESDFSLLIDALPGLLDVGGEEEADPFSNFEDEAIVTFSTLDPVTPAKSNGLKAIVLSLLGNYESIVVQYQYSNNNGTVSYLREVYPDYPWIASAVIFVVVLYCCIRLGAAILCRK